MGALKVFKRPDRLTVFSGIAAFLLAFSLAVGAHYALGSARLACLFDFAIYLPISWFLIKKLYTFFDKRSRRRHKKVSLDKTHFSIKNFLIFFAIVTIPAVILLLAFWPGIFGYDVGGEMVGVGSYTTHHPIAHQLWLHAITGIGQAWHLSANQCVAMMSISQILVCGAIYAYISELISRISSKKVGIVFALIVGLLPASSFSMIAITKDTTHVAFFVLMIALTYRLLCLKKIQKKNIVFYILALSLFGITRHNSTYILPLLAIFAFFLLKRTTKQKVITLSILASFVATLLLNFGLKTVTNAYDIQQSAAFSLPLQLVGGTVNAHPELIPEINSGEKILGFFEYSTDEHDYSFYEKGADITKNNSFARQIKGRETEFLLLTARTGLRYPLDYWRVFATQTVSSWYPFSYDYANYYNRFGARNNFEETRLQSTEMLSGVEERSKLPWLRNCLVYEFRDLHFTSNPVLTIICAPASYVLALIVFFLYQIYRKDKLMIFITSSAVCCYLIVLVAAPCILIRYMEPVMLAVPLLYIFTFCSKSSIINPLRTIINRNRR